MYSYYTNNTKIENIANNLEAAKQKTENKRQKENIRQLENKYLILDILKENIEDAINLDFNILNKEDREFIEQNTLKELTPSEYYKSEKITGFLIHENYYKTYLQIRKEQREKERNKQTITREETPKEAEIIKQKPVINIDFNNLFKWIFIISTGIVLIPLYMCIAITKNLK